MIRFLSLLLLLYAPHLYSQEQMQVSRCYKVNWDGPIQNIFIDEDQNKWVSTGQSLFKVLACDLIEKVDLQPGQKSLLQMRDGNYDLIFSLSEFMETGENVRTAHFDAKRSELWIGTTYSGVLVFQVVDGGLRLSETLTRRNSKLISDQINAIYLDSNGRLWIGTDAGVLVRSNGRWDLLERDHRFNAIAEYGSTIGILSEDIIWLVTANNVITRKEIDPASFRGNIRDIAFGQEGHLWMASNAVTRYDLESDRFVIYDGPAYFTSELATCLVVDDQNVVWVGTDDKGLYVIERESNLVALIELEQGITCNSESTRAALRVKVSGGEPPYQYQWQGDIAGPNPTEVGPGTHSVVITDSKGKTTRAQINVPDPSLAISVTNREDIHPDTSDLGAAEVIIERGEAPFTYSWDNGETGRIAQNLTEGIHSVTVTAGNGCMAVQQVSVAKPVKGMAVYINEILRNKCAGQRGGSLKVLISGGQGPFIFVWNNPAITGGDPRELPAGNYQVTVTDSLGNSDSASFTLIDPSEIRLSIELVAPSNVNQPDGQALARVSGGSGNYSFLWDNGEELSFAKNLNPGTHSLTVTDANGCTATSTVDIPEYISSLSVSFTQTAVNVCNGDRRASIEVNVQGGLGPFGYKWNDPALSGTQLTGLAAGNYTVTVSDQSGKTASSSLFVREPPPISITTLVIEPGSTGNEDGVARAEATGGNGTFKYLWDNGETGQDATSLAPGTHFVTVTDIQNCTATASVQIPENVLTLVLNISQTKRVDCSGEDQAEVTVEVLGGKPPFQYAWNEPGRTGNLVSGLRAGEYRVTVTDNSGQSESAAITVLDPRPLSANVSIQNAAETGQANGQALVSINGGTGNYSIDWDNGEKGPGASRLAPGPHNVTITDDNGCQIIKSVEMEENIRPLAVDLVQTKGNTCAGDTLAALQVQLSGGKGPFQYRWNKAFLSGNQVSGLPAGTYQITVTDAAGQASNKSILIRDPEPLRVSASVDEPAGVAAADGKATALASGGNGRYSYKWDNGEVGAQATILNSGTHTVTVVDVNQCTSTTTVLIPEKITELAISLDLIRGNPCYGSSLASVQVRADGGKAPYQYRWNQQNVSGDRTTSLSAGNYQVTVADASGQTKSARISITDPPPIMATTSLESIEGIQKARVQASGGSGNYIYRWDNGETTAIADSLGPGSHSVTVRDTNGCSVTTNIEMPDEMFPLSVQLVQLQGNPCAGDQKAAIEIKSSGGKRPFQLRWNDSTSSEEKRTGLSAGVYEVTVIDSNGEEYQASIEIEDPKPLRVQTFLLQPAGAGKTDGQATAIASGGTGSHSFVWDNGESFPMISNLSPGNLSVTVRDENGCTSSAELLVTEDILPLTIELLLNGQNLCAGDRKVSIQALISGGKAPFQFIWSDPDLSGDKAIDLTGGTYSVTITDDAGTTFSETVSIPEPPPLTVQVTPTQAASSGNSDGQALATASGGTGGYSFIWDNGETSAKAGNLSPGNHSVTVRDENGCISSTEVMITEDILPLAVELIQSAKNICAGDQIAAIHAQISGGKKPFQLQWNDDALTGDQLYGLKAGLYRLNISDALNNKSTAEIQLTDPEPVSVRISDIQPANTGRSDGHATIVAEGGTGEYSYLWDNGETTATAVQLSPGSHTVNVTDQNECTVTADLVISEEILPLQANLVETEQNSCSGDQKAAIQVQLTGGKQPYQYRWNHEDLAGDQLAELPPGHYSVTVTDGMGNSVDASITLNDPVPLSVTVHSVQPASTEQSDGQASVSVSGGKEDYRYLWGNGSTQPTASDLNPGIHSITITDANGCVVSAQVEITENILPLSVELSQTTLNHCAGDKNATISTQLSGGKGPFQYQWSDSTLTEAHLTGLADGTYALTVNDAINQTGSASITVESPPQLNVSVVEPRPATDESSADGRAQVVVQGGTTPYSISWDNGESGPEAVGLNIGKHSVTVRDALGCTSSSEFEISKKILLQLTSNRLRSGQLIRMEQLFFEADSTDLEETSKPVLDELYGFMKDNPSVIVRVEGHTNDLPPHEFCDWLSSERAKAVAEYIVGKGIVSERVYYRGYGKRQPVYSNLTAEGRRLNQRVEINILEIGNDN